MSPIYTFPARTSPNFDRLSWSSLSPTTLSKPSLVALPALLASETTSPFKPLPLRYSYFSITLYYHKIIRSFLTIIPFPDSFFLFFFCSCLQLALHSLNSSRSAYQSINFKPAFFDAYTVSGNLAQFSVHLKVGANMVFPLLTSNYLRICVVDVLCSGYLCSFQDSCYKH